MTKLEFLKRQLKQPTLLENIKKKAKEMDTKRLQRMVDHFGTVSTKKLLASTL